MSGPGASARIGRADCGHDACCHAPESLDESVTVQSIPPHTYDHCLETAETSPLEPDVLENKFYAPDVGNVLTVDVDNVERSDLIEIRTGADGSARWTAVVRAALGRRRCR